MLRRAMSANAVVHRQGSDLRHFMHEPLYEFMRGTSNRKSSTNDSPQAERMVQIPSQEPDDVELAVAPDRWRIDSQTTGLEQSRIPIKLPHMKQQPTTETPTGKACTATAEHAE